MEIRKTVTANDRLSSRAGWRADKPGINFPLLRSNSVSNGIAEIFIDLLSRLLPLHMICVIFFVVIFILLSIQNVNRASRSWSSLCRSLLSGSEAHVSEPNWTFLHELSQSDAVFFTNGAKAKKKNMRGT